MPLWRRRQPGDHTEFCLQTARTPHRHAGPVWRSASGRYTRGIGIPSGGTAPEGAYATPGSRMEAGLQRVRSPASGRYACGTGHPHGGRAPDDLHPTPAARCPCLVLLGINSNRKQCWYRCEIVMSSLGTSSPNYRGVMRFIGGAHDPRTRSTTLNLDHHQHLLVLLSMFFVDPYQRSRTKIDLYT